MAGYNLYRGLTRDTIDYTTPIATAGEVSSLEVAQTDLVADTEYWYCIRAFDLEEDLANDVFVTIKSDENGEYIPRPNSPTMLKFYLLPVIAVKAMGNRNSIRLTWNYNNQEEGAAVDHYVIYYDNGTGVIDYDYSQKLATSTDTEFTSGPLSNGSYQFAVRARSAAGYEDNNFESVAVALDNTGPPDISAILLSVGF